VLRAAAILLQATRPQGSGYVRRSPAFGKQQLPKSPAKA